MFYSQFILAKKGPLGTIWIAAHLERKLRKNQVADTDIGVSVDSILFPEVPIALRLSSHLLLGVVRIYSRKVNYLFDDCSETFLKIKQAFRSTAVDLPPEESTAPYHSITLPETFDLEDFELPDNDIFQGNYVDHHISSREQITLQDTLGSVVYSTSQFGLDERFGDGDTSGVDLDEELFLDKVAASGPADVILNTDADPQTSVQPMTPLKQNENHDEMTSNFEMEGVDGDTHCIDYAQAPSTPGLREEPNVSNFKEISAFDDHLEHENHNLTEPAVKENSEKAFHESGFHNENEVSEELCMVNGMNPSTRLYVPSEDTVSLSVGPQGELPITAENVADISSDNPALAPVPSSISADQIKAISPLSESSDRINSESDCPEQLQNFQDGIISNDVPNNHPPGMTYEMLLDAEVVRSEGNSLDMPRLCSASQPEQEEALESNKSYLTELCIVSEIAGDLEKSNLPRNVVESNSEFHGASGLEVTETHAFLEPNVFEVLETVVHEEVASSDIHVLRRCNVHQKNSDTVVPLDVGLWSPETSVRGSECHSSGAFIPLQGEEPHKKDGLQVFLEKNHTTEPVSHENMPAVSSKSSSQVDNFNSADSLLENVELPPPEKLLSMTEGLANVSNNLLVESTPDRRVFVESDLGGAGSKIISGKKRCFSESTLTVQSLDSIESPGVMHARRSAESVPDDDDLLSSILVGRRSSVLKVKSSPPPETRSMKRPRSVLQTSSSKRKVLMDDTMVLHGDTIRLQLTSTEDIRRVRKKAPCTRPEISMIQKQLLEDELFSEPLLTGFSMQLVSLHNHAYDLSEIRVSKNDANNASSEVAYDMKLTSHNKVNAFLETSNGVNTPIVPSATNETAVEYNDEPRATDGGMQPVETCVLTEKINSEFTTTPVQVNPICDVVEPKTTDTGQFEQTNKTEQSGGSLSVKDTSTFPSGTVEIQSPYPGIISDNTCDISAGVCQLASLDRICEADVSQQMLVSCASLDQQSSIPSIEMEASAGELRSAAGVSGKMIYDISASENEFESRIDFWADGIKGCASGEIKTDADEDFSGIQKGSNASPMRFSYEVGRCSQQAAIVDQATAKSGENELEIMNRVENLTEAEYNVEDLTCHGICTEEPKIDSSYSAEVHVQIENATFKDDKTLAQQEAYPSSTLTLDGPNIDPATIIFRDDSDCSTVGHDTEFLNVDDDEVAAADDDSMPDAEETRFIENSGWSSRSRAVAKYLQILFDKDEGHGRKIIPMDNLLVGKTRKEASRMFFEALVLKTKDYIHVEQENPFDKISIKPQAKLMKSDF